jgi:CheY-like chemotaxis protein
VSRKVVAAVTDLFFVAKLKAAAHHADVELAFASSRDEVYVEAQGGAGMVILDLNDPGMDAAATVRALRSDPLTAVVPTLAFYSHVETDTADAARIAGCDRVLPRSRFSRDLVELLRDVGTE